MQTVLKISPLFWCLDFVWPSSKLTLSSMFSVSVHLSRTQIKLTIKPKRRASLTCARSVFNCSSSIIETKGTKGRCGGAWAQLCSAFCLTGGSLPEEAERDGGEGRAEGTSSSTSFISLSLRNGTLKGTVKSNTGLVLGGEKTKNGDKESPRAETTNFYTRSCVSFPRRCHDAPRFLDRTMFLFWYKCGVVVLYSTLFSFNFLHFRHVSISNDLHWPWECLILCILPEWVLRNLHRKDKTSLGDQTSSKSPKRQLLRAKRFAPQWNRHFSLWFFFFSPSFFFHLFPNLFDMISSLSIRVSAPQNYQTCPVVLKQSLLGLCATFQTEQASGSSVNRKPVYGGRVFQLGKNVNLSNNIERKSQ